MSNTLTSTDYDYHMPAEWEPHSACLLLFPHNACTFRRHCRPAQDQVLQVARAIVHHGKEDVVLFCLDEQKCQELQSKLGHNETRRITVAVCPSNDTWARDTGPTFVVGNHTIMELDWNFNAYGGPTDGCYWPCEADQQVASTMCTWLSQHYSINISTKRIPLVLEGGSIHTDGQGTILTTKECLLHSNRNPKLSQTEIESILLQELGCTKIIWLPLGLFGDDDTNGHVDNFACFSQPGHVLLSWTDDDEGDVENYKRCRQAHEVLNREIDAQGRALTIHKLHLPPPMFYTEDDVKTLGHREDNAEVARMVGDRLAASYANFYISNRAIIVPQFGITDGDARAIQQLQEAFPNHNVVGVPSREILLGGGNIHCITQQVPKMYTLM
jgi:agmatine deiminase